MDLSTIKEYFQACCQFEQDLQQNRNNLTKIPAYTLYKTIATQSQSNIDQNLIKQFILTFNWQAMLVKPVYQEERAGYQVHNRGAEMTIEKLLDFGIELFVAYWGANQCINFDQFSIFAKGVEELPVKDKEVPYATKKLFIEVLMKQIQNLINLEQLKKVVFYTYKNLSDLFESLTATSQVGLENIQRLFLSYSVRKSQIELKSIAKRARLPWDFNNFIQNFKRNTVKKEHEIIIYHSSARRNKNQDKSFTTPRKQKLPHGQSSTKLTKNQTDQESISKTPQTLGKTSRKMCSPTLDYQNQNIYIEKLSDLLKIEEEFIRKCTELVVRKDFDLELIYNTYGKYFEQILNTRYGCCNFTAFVRFIVPCDFQHRYLSFIRYQSDHKISRETQNAIYDIIECYMKKQQQIQALWNKCDKQMFLRNFCKPNQASIKNDKLREIFTVRQTNVLLSRLDPNRTGNIIMEALK